MHMFACKFSATCVRERDEACALVHAAVLVPFAPGWRGHCLGMGIRGALPLSHIPILPPYGAQGLQQLYTAVVLAIIVLNVVMQMNPNFGSEKWRLRRSLTYGAVIAFGVSRPTFVAWNQL